MKKRLLCAALCLMMLVSLFIPMTAMAEAVDTAAAEAENVGVWNARNGVVRIYIIAKNGDTFIGTGFGVGTVGEPTDTFVTNWHVVTGEDTLGREDVLAGRIYICPDVAAMSQEMIAYKVGESYYRYDSIYDVDIDRLIPCDVLQATENPDLAVIKAIRKVENRVAIELAETSESAQVSNRIYSLGYPGISDEIMNTGSWEATGKTAKIEIGGGSYVLPLYTRIFKRGSTLEDMSLTDGIVSRRGTMDGQEQTMVIQHNAEIHGGNSGGPLVNSKGQVVGVNTWSSSSGEASLNYAIFVDHVHEILKAAKVSYNIKPETEEVKEEDVVPETTEVIETTVPETTVPATTEPVPPTPIDPGDDDKLLLIGGIVAAIVVLAVVAVLVIKKSKPKKPVQPPMPIKETAVPQKEQPAECTLRFQGVSGTFAGKRYSVNGTVRFGRNPAQCDVVYPADAQGISGVHCALINQNGRLYLQDLGSTYGTFLANGQKLAAQQQVEVRLGDKFYLGSEREMFAIVPRGGN